MVEVVRLSTGAALGRGSERPPTDTPTIVIVGSAGAWLGA